MKAFLAISELQATAAHIANVQAKIATLEATKHASWEQTLARVADMWRRGDLTDEQLATLTYDMAGSFGRGHQLFWDRRMPVKFRTIRTTVAQQRRIIPNGPNGSWHGVFPIQVEDQRPPYGQAVVYVLFDDTNTPVYVGSTEAFRHRMAPHYREKPNLARWVAYPCHDREHAYEVEDRVLREHLPAMNRRASR